MVDRSDEALWEAVRDNEGWFFAARVAFLANASDRVGVLRAALGSVPDRGTALRLLPYCSVEERQRLFDDLVRLCSVGHRDVLLCREGVLSLPRDWVLDRIESSAEPVLATGGHEEYQRLLELYVQLDPELARRLAVRAARHPDPDVRDSGEYFLERPGP